MPSLLDETPYAVTYWKKRAQRAERWFLFAGIAIVFQWIVIFVGVL
jgi:hypothetical protein